MSSRDRPRDDDLEERLDELEGVLAELRQDLQREERDRGGPPRPPRLSELLRFTEQYTIPTLIAVLETTIRSLKLLQGTLRLADPGRGLADDADADRATDRLAGVRDEASAGVVRSLSELRTALSEADLPEDAASRSIIREARDLTAEIEDRIEEGRREADRGRRERGGRRDREDRRDRGDRLGRSDEPREGRRDRGSEGRDDVVRIDVTDPDGTDDAGETDDADEESESNAAANVDVESELESIKRQFDEPDDATTERDEHGASDAERNDATRNGAEDEQPTGDAEPADAGDDADDGDEER